MYRKMIKNKIINNKIIYVGKAEKIVSIRLPSKIYNIIISHDGKNFSDKLIRLVLEYHELSDLNSSGNM